VADTALLIIATGERYHRFIEPLLESARRYFVPHDSVLWTDSADSKSWSATQVITKKPLGFPGETLNRYSTIISAYNILLNYKHLYYVDVDMLFVDHVDPTLSEVDGLVATLHPGFVGTEGTPERRKESRAYIEPGSDNHYFCGGFNGGSTMAYLNMAAELAVDIEVDRENGITAIWHDESHLNRYLFDHPPALILNPSYCYVEGSESPRHRILIALSKGWCRTCGAATKPHVNDCGRHRA
jgi:histo-blood group ABO system transferase